MIEEIIGELGITSHATNVIDAISFLITTTEDIAELKDVCRHGDVQSVNIYLIEKRKQKVSSNKFINIEEFVCRYNVDPIGTLERLCQERLDSNKLSKLKSNDPVRIYKIHNSRGAYTRFMELALFA
ncbi:hypothetical protein ACIFOE_13050 [Paenibacillus sp. NRS-1783]|uniref:hypothetical protein n=1 Tax=Paenibacillus sp. NRS-1783 TaxID=3233907 RepID=UPI003D29788B